MLAQIELDGIRSIPMSSLPLNYVVTLITLDLLLGVLLLFWPGIWHELLHGWIERTTFFIPQALGGLMVARATHIAYMGRHMGTAHRCGHAYLWFGQAFVCFVVALRLLGDPMYASIAYFSGTLGAVFLGWQLWSRSTPKV